MHRSLLSRVAALAVATAGFTFAAIPALADDFGKRFTIDIEPVYQASVTGDAAAPPPAGSVGLGYTSDHPNPASLRLDYALNYKIDKKSNFYFSHSDLDFAIGRVLTIAPHVALVSGEIADRTDTLGISHDLGGGLIGRIYYFNHSRMDVTGLCLNQQYCPVGGQQTGNPSSIDEHGYGVGGSYSLGPKTRIGKLFTIGVDAKYIPRSSTPPTTAPNLGGLGAYVGSDDSDHRLRAGLGSVPRRSDARSLQRDGPGSDPGSVQGRVPEHHQPELLRLPLFGYRTAAG